MKSDDPGADPLRAIILAHAPRAARGSLATLLELDDTLGAVPKSTREPAIAQIRLQWWREHLEALDRTTPPAHPLLRALADTLLPLGLTGARLAKLVEGWDILVESEVLDDEALRQFGEARGEQLFALAGDILNARPPADGGAGWALADLANGLSDPADAERAYSLSRAALGGCFDKAWPRGARSLGMLALAAAMRHNQVALSGRQMGRLIWHRWTGR